MSDPTIPLTHGTRELPDVLIDAYNAEIRDEEGFIGDRASSRAFGSILEDWRDRMRQVSGDPLDEQPSGKLHREALDGLLIQGDIEAAGLVLSAVEEFAQALSQVCQRLLKLEGWHKTEAIVVGGGFRASRIGELAIGRASVLLKASGHQTALRPIHHDPDAAGLLGSARLFPHWMLAEKHALLAVDIGGSNIRAGLVRLEWQGRRLANITLTASRKWRHRDAVSGRDEAIKQLVKMLTSLIGEAEKQQFKLAAVIGIGCPGLINADGTIERGGQNLPGDWEAADFNLPRLLQSALPMIGEQEARVLLHNDAVVQALSELPYMVGTKHWGALTIGTGLGNVHLTTRR